VKATLEAINQMQADGVIGKYAIGGAVGATLYLEPAATLDIDIFVVLPTVPGSSLLTLTPLYDYLKARGWTVRDEHVAIGGWPVQFLPPSNDLEQEAVAASVETTVEGINTWVMSAEHLVAIALHDVLARHGLVAKWKQFERKYLEGTHE
jgi:hypothetical protein